MKNFYSYAIIFSFLILLFLSSCTVSEERENDLTKLGWNGDIKSSITTQYFATQSFGEIEKDASNPIIIIHREFNKSGNITLYRKISFGPKNDTTDFFYINNLYNENQQVVETIKYNDDGRKISSSSFKFDDKGNNIKSTFYKDDGSINYVSMNEYDEKKQLVTKQTYNSDGSKSISYSYKYDELGNCVEETTFYSSGKVMYKDKSKYDIFNNMTENIRYDKSGSVIEKEKYQYDNKGRFILSYSQIEYTEEAEDSWSIDYEYTEVDEQDNWITRNNTDVSNFYTVSNRIFEYY